MLSIVVILNAFVAGIRESMNRRGNREGREGRQGRQGRQE
jgi:hypothetical protein